MYPLSWFARLSSIMMLAGCASIASDTDTQTQITAQPMRVRCELHGHDFSKVVYTPASVQLPARAAPVILVCSAQGYLTATLNIDTETDGWIFGNILLGGPIGILVDGARGAGQKYSQKVSITLEPESFESPAARDVWFDRQRQSITERSESILAKLRRSCEERGESSDSCSEELKRVQEQRDAKLKTLELRRVSAKIRHSGV